MGAIVSAIVGWVGALLARSTVVYLALKGLLFVLFVSVLPVVINNLIYKLLQGSMDVVGTTAGSAHSTVVALAGIAGYLGSVLRLPEALSVMLSAVATRFALKLIPFTRL
jgi:hypothetical protein